MIKNTITSALIGKKLSYSLSQIIHAHYKNNNYALIETDNFFKIFEDNQFFALSVTNPYKQDAYNFCTIHDEIATNTGIVNTMLYKNNIWYGYNTDYHAFAKMLEAYKIDLLNKSVLIIGNGSTSKTIGYYLNKNNINYNVIARHPRNDNEILLDKHYFDNTNVIIQTTSYGVFPNIENDTLLDYTKFNNLEMIIDVNYNPRRPYTANFAKYYNGLLMLVYNGLLFEELLQGCPIKDDALAYSKYLDSQMANIVLIGMPYSGKTTIGKILSNDLKKAFFDTDIILKSENNDLVSCLNSGKDVVYFRVNESLLVKELSSTKFSSIISTGGGVILNVENINYLKQNGIIIYLDATASTLKNRCNFEDRPLIKSINDIDKVYNERKTLYEKYADIIIDGNQPINEVVKTIEVKLNEYFNN